MPFAGDKLYNGYLRRKMPAIVSKVKVREIIPHLPCLTLTDREEIEAKREVYGNFNAMQLLLDCLRRRENWAEEFIEALEACEHTTLAAEIRAEYNSLRGNDNPNSSSPSATVARVHLHPAPTSHVSVPQSADSSQAAAAAAPSEESAPPSEESAPPSEESAPPQPPAQASASPEAPMQPETPPSPAVHNPKAAPPLELVAESPKSPQTPVAPPPSTPPPSTPPPSPVTPHHRAATPPPPLREVNAHQEPEENSESDIQDVSCDSPEKDGEVSVNSVLNPEPGAGESEVSVNSVLNLEPSHPVEQCETDAPSCPDPLQTTPVEVGEIQTNSEGTVEPSSTVMNPEKSPVQDTSPPVDKVSADVLQPEETSELPTTQVTEISQQTEDADTTSRLAGAALMDASLCDNSAACLSKPGQLISIQVQNHDNPTIPASVLQEGPYSGNSDRLEISNAAPDSESSGHIPSCSADDPTIMSRVTPPPCLENGFAVEPLNHNEPEENTYESLCQSSLEDQEVLVNVVQVAEEPSVLNHDGQTLTPQAQIVNGEAAKEPASAPPPPPTSTTNADSVSKSNAPSTENCPSSSDSAPADYTAELKTPEEPGKKTHTSPNKKYILTAAGVGACALLIAWKLKK